MNYPITGTEINIQFDTTPDNLLTEVFGVNSPFFNDWALSRTNSENYSLYYENAESKTWCNKVFKTIKRIDNNNNDNVETIIDYDNQGRTSSIITSNGFSSVWKYNEDTYTLIMTNVNRCVWHEYEYDYKGNSKLKNFGSIPQGK